MSDLVIVLIGAISYAIVGFVLRGLRIWKY